MSRSGLGNPEHALKEDHPALATLNANVDAFLKKTGYGKDNSWMQCCDGSYPSIFDQVADKARKGEKGADKLAQNIFSQQKPNFGDTLANCQQKSDVETGVALFGQQVENVSALLPDDRENLHKKVSKMAELKSLCEDLDRVADERGKPFGENIIASLNFAQRAMGLGRTLLEAFERKGIAWLDELVKKLLVVGLFVLQELGKHLLPLQHGPWKEHVFHATMRLAADCYSHLALAVRYEAHYVMTDLVRRQDRDSLSKAHSLLTDGHTLCEISMKYRAWAGSPSRMTSSMNGIVQNTEFFYVLDALAANITKGPRVFTELATLEKRIELWKMCGGVRWATADAWGLLDTSRRLPNIFLQKAVLEGSTVEHIQEVWTNGMRVRQLLLGLLLHPEGDVGYNRYPGFLAPITLAELLHDMAEAEAILGKKDARLSLGTLCGWGSCDAATMCDILRQYFSVHGEVGNFFELEHERFIKKATLEEQVAFRRNLMSEQSDEDSSILPSIPANKFTSLIWSVVCEENSDSPYLAVLKRLARALRTITRKEHALWKPGKNITEALSLDDPDNAPAQELAVLVGYRAPGTNYVTSETETREGRIVSVGQWRPALCKEAATKVSMP